VSPPNPDLLAAALEGLALGWSIIPVGAAKKAAVKWRQWQTTRADRGQLEKWFAPRRYDGLALVCGPVSAGLVVRDFDDANGYEKWAMSFPKLAQALPTSRTARGYHVFFRNGLEKIIHLAGGSGELRGDGYCILPPSLHPSSVAYSWLVKPNGQVPLIADIDAAGLGELSQRSREAEKQRSREAEKVENLKQ